MSRATSGLRFSQVSLTHACHGKCGVQEPIRATTEEPTGNPAFCQIVTVLSGIGQFHGCIKGRFRGNITVRESYRECQCFNHRSLASNA
jgi:hypothetical protein